MGPGVPLSVRLPLALFRRLVALLPEEFRRAWLREADADLEATLGERLARRGAAAAAWAGLCAVGDVARALPREWWAALARRRDPARRGRGPETGERIMSWIRELRLAARALARRPGYAAAAVLTLGLGIGANAAIFTVVNAILLRPLPYPDADRIVTIRHHAPALGLPELNNSPGTLRFYRQEADFLGAMAGYAVQQRNFLGGPDPERVQVAAATPGIFDVLRVQPALGRPFYDADAAEGAAPVALLTHAAWTARFGADRAVLGRTVVIDGVTTEIVGVLPEGLAFPDRNPVALIPLFVDPAGSFGTFGTALVARLAPGVGLDEAARRASALQGRLPGFFAAEDLDQSFLDRAGWGATLERYQDEVVGDDVASTLWIVLGTVGFVLLIACANVANLFLVRAESRQKELAIRAAMGAGWGRIAGGFLSEALVLGAAGGALGLVLAWGGIGLLVARGPQGVPRLHEASVDAATLAFTAGVSLLAALALGALPMVKYAGAALARLLRDGGRGSTDGRERHRARDVLVAVQLSLALVLLVGCGLMLRSFQALRAVDPGFDPEDVLTVGMSLGEGVDDREGAEFYQRVADRVRALPGVRRVGLSTLVPMGGGSANGGSFYIDSKPRDEKALPPVAMYKAIGADYLEAVGQELLEGRALTRSDWEGGPPVALVNRTFADRFLDGRALGEGIRWDSAAASAEVVGVVADARERRLRDEAGPWAYLPMVVGDWGYPNMDRAFLVIRTEPGAAVPVAAVREIVRGLNASVPLTLVRTMDEVLREQAVDTSFTMALLGIAAAVALFIGAVGLFGVVSYVVAQRTREIGVRVALGARGEDIGEMVFRQSGRVALAGVVLGLLGALALTRLMEAVLFGVSATDLPSFLAAPATLLAVAAVATWLPARRASRVDPIEALRTE